MTAAAAAPPTSSQYPYPACSSLCGRRAVLNLEISSSISLPMCVACWKKIDPDGKYLFELIEEEEKAEEALKVN